MADENVRQLEEEIAHLKLKMEFYPDKATLQEIKTFIVHEQLNAHKWITWLVIVLSGLALSLLVVILRQAT